MGRAHCYALHSLKASLARKGETEHVPIDDLLIISLGQKVLSRMGDSERLLDMPLGIFRPNSVTWHHVSGAATLH